MGSGSSDYAFMLENCSSKQKTDVSSPQKKEKKEKQIKKCSTQSCEKDFKHDGLFSVRNLSHLPNLEDNSFSPNIVAKL